MTHKIIRTEDGSNSIFVESLGQSYHSSFGAIAESQHIFIKDGLQFINPISDINILEIGFGTGLNALLSLAFARE
ncbi:SAM-dependent methyltransferase, partial [bacterium]|nr:SAM-dependent methyltransferase [bacterium]